MCIKDVYYKSSYDDEEMCYFDKDKVYEVDKEYDYGISVYVTFNDPPSSFMFYYDNVGLPSEYYHVRHRKMYEDYFISLEDHRESQIDKLI